MVRQRRFALVCFLGEWLLSTNTKLCERCGREFHRPTRYHLSEKNWAKRRFCGRRCSSPAVWIEKNGALRPTCLCGCGRRTQHKWIKEHKPEWRDKTKQGYIRLWRPGHPLAGKHGFVLEHRYLVYEAGIEVPPGYDVHHVNETRDDNRLENLEVLPKDEHYRLHMRRHGVRNQFGVWKMAETPEERRIRNRDWMREKRRKLREAKGDTLETA